MLLALGIGDLAGWLGLPSVNIDVLVLIVVCCAAGVIGSVLGARVGIVALVVLLVVARASTGPALAKIRAEGPAAVAAWLDEQTTTIERLRAEPGVMAAVPMSCGGVGPILATIRQLESGNNYSAQNAYATASGAYQFVDGTWRSLGGQDYPGKGDAKNAAPAEQDRVASLLVEQILGQHGDVGAVPLVWYLGHVPDAAAMNTVPAAAGNTLTPAQYQAKWLAEYARQTAGCVEG